MSTLVVGIVVVLVYRILSIPKKNCLDVSISSVVVVVGGLVILILSNANGLKAKVVDSSVFVCNVVVVFLLVTLYLSTNPAAKVKSSSGVVEIVVSNKVVVTV